MSMPAADPDDAQVVYSVRELLERIETKQTEGFTRMEVSMAAKADKADVARLEVTLAHHARQLEHHNSELDRLRQWRRDRETAAEVHDRHVERRLTARQKWLASIGSLLIVAATVGGPILAALVTH